MKFDPRASHLQNPTHVRPCGQTWTRNVASFAPPCSWGAARHLKVEVEERQRQLRRERAAGLAPHYVPLLFAPPSEADAADAAADDARLTWAPVPDAMAEQTAALAALVTAETVGAAEGALAITTSFAKEREQFGSKIGRYQGVKHPLAEIYVDIESYKSLVYYAFWALDEGHDDAQWYDDDSWWGTAWE